MIPAGTTWVTDPDDDLAGLVLNPREGLVVVALAVAVNLIAWPITIVLAYLFLT